MDKKKMERMLAVGVEKIVGRNVNLACTWWHYQQKIPKGALKLKKIKMKGRNALLYVYIHCRGE